MDGAARTRQRAQIRESLKAKGSLCGTSRLLRLWSMLLMTASLRPLVPMLLMQISWMCAHCIDCLSNDSLQWNCCGDGCSWDSRNEHLRESPKSLAGHSGPESQESLDKAEKSQKLSFDNFLRDLQPFPNFLRLWARRPGKTLRLFQCMVARIAMGVEREYLKSCQTVAGLLQAQATFDAYGSVLDGSERDYFKEIYFLNHDKGTAPSVQAGKFILFLGAEPPCSRWQNADLQRSRWKHIWGWNLPDLFYVTQKHLAEVKKRTKEFEYREFEGPLAPPQQEMLYIWACLLYLEGRRRPKQKDFRSQGRHVQGVSRRDTMGFFPADICLFRQETCTFLQSKRPVLQNIRLSMQDIEHEARSFTVGKHEALSLSQAMKQEDGN